MCIRKYKKVKIKFVLFKKFNMFTKDFKEFKFDCHYFAKND